MLGWFSSRSLPVAGGERHLRPCLKRSLGNLNKAPKADVPQRVCEQPAGHVDLGSVWQLLLSGGEGLGHSQGRTQLWGAGAAFAEAQRAGCAEGKLLLWLLLGSLSKVSTRHACQQRSDLQLAKASLSRASGSTSVGTGGATPSHLPAVSCHPGRGGPFLPERRQRRQRP